MRQAASSRSLGCVCVLCCTVCEYVYKVVRVFFFPPRAGFGEGGGGVFRSEKRAGGDSERGDSFALGRGLSGSFFCGVCVYVCSMDGWMDGWMVLWLPGDTKRLGNTAAGSGWYGMSVGTAWTVGMYVLRVEYFTSSSTEQYRR